MTICDGMSPTSRNFFFCARRENVKLFVSFANVSIAHFAHLMCEICCIVSYG